MGTGGESLHPNPRTMTYNTLTREQLNAKLIALQLQYSAVVERGGYAPRLFVEIDNITRELATR